jgi:hypothetical protein
MQQPCRSHTEAQGPAQYLLLSPASSEGGSDPVAFSGSSRCWTGCENEIAASQQPTFNLTLLQKHIVLL